MLAAAQEARGIEALLTDARSGADWADASCRDGTAGMVELFFSEQLDDIARAKAICALCPVAEPCFQGALARREPWGVWGGQLFANGKVLAQKRRRGRPPKNPRPDVQLTA